MEDLLSFSSGMLDMGGMKRITDFYKMELSESGVYNNSVR